MYPREKSVPTTPQLPRLDSEFLGELELFPMTPAPRQSQSLPVTGAVSLSRIEYRRVLVLLSFAEETLWFHLATLGPFVAIFTAFKAHPDPIWAL